MVVLAIAGGDDATALRSFLRAHSVAYPVLLDSERKVTERFHVVGVPRTMVFDRGGMLDISAL
jgi:peroxiredoxin